MADHESELPSRAGTPQPAVVQGAKRSKMLEKMARAPQGDWTIADVKTLCSQVGLEFREPKHGSHYKVFCKELPGMLTIPARKPIKTVYIRLLAAMANTYLAKKRDA